MTDKIAIVGAGLVGRAWAIVFARAGHPVALFDIDEAALEPAPKLLQATLDELRAADLIAEPPETVRERIALTTDLEEALAGAAYVQENVPEKVEAKTEIFARMDAAAGPDAILASSTSGIPASAFTADLPGRGRCLVAHPINPPSLVPLVELVPAPWTDADVVERARALHERAGQRPIVLGKEVAGFVVNRLQGALLNEALALFEDGLIGCEDLDKAIKDGLGLRWSFMGPLETIDLNAPGGIRDYMNRYGPLYHQIAEESRPRGYSEELLSRLEDERRKLLPSDARDERMAWRDRRLIALVAHKRSNETP